MTSISQRQLGRRLTARLVATGVRVRESSFWTAVEIEVPFEEISETVTRIRFRSKRWGIAAAACVALALVMAVVDLTGGDTDAGAVAFYGAAALFCAAGFVLSSRRYDRYGELVLFSARAAGDPAEAFLHSVFERRRAFLRDKYLAALASARHPRAQLAAELRQLGVFDESEIEVLAARLSQGGDRDPGDDGPGSSGGSSMPN